MEEQMEQWELGSGTWLRDRMTEEWRLVATRAGTVVAPSLPPQDVARMIEARSGPTSGEWFPPEFNYSVHTGAPLRAAAAPTESSWLPPFGESALPGAEGLGHGLRRTPVSLSVARARDRSASDAADRTLPPLPRGQYRFVVDRFDVGSPTLIAVEPEQGKLLVLLPESGQWMPLQASTSTSWAQRLLNVWGWRMELVRSHGRATAYGPCASGLAAITPSVFGLGYEVELIGESPALGGPVAWRSDLWTPVVGKGERVHLLGKPQKGAGHMHIVLETPAPVPLHGFVAPVLDDLHVTWPCEQGQLVLRLDAAGEKQADWIPWPEHVRPIFAVGCPYLQQNGSFWQLCRRLDGSFEYLQMGVMSPRVEPLEAVGLCTGRVCYRGATRMDDAPWSRRHAADAASPEIVLPLLESSHDGAVLGLRMDAPHGLLALLHGVAEPKRAILQVQVQGQPAVSLGAITVKRPWIAVLFVHDGHVWIHHPELPQALGWELDV